MNDNGFCDLDLTLYLKADAPPLKPLIPLDHVNQQGLAFVPGCICAGDYEFFCNLFRTGLRLRLLGESFYLYRMTPGSLSKNDSFLLSKIEVLKRLLQAEGFSAGEREMLSLILSRDERYAPLQVALRKKDLAGAVRTALTRPGSVLEFLRRLPVSLQYRLAAWRLGGYWG